MSANSRGRRAKATTRRLGSRLYAGADWDPDEIPWANLKPNPALVQWLDLHPPAKSHRRALVVGCGLGDDAEELAARGFVVTAFDISAAAVAWCKQRFPASRVNYMKSPIFSNRLSLGLASLVHRRDLHDPIPLAELHAKAMESLAGLLAPGGEMYCSGRNPKMIRVPSRFH